MANIQDVARAAGVSRSTVSYVLSGSRPISEETKARVHRAMEEVQFRPNAMARGLANRRSRILALLMASGTDTADGAEMDIVRAAALAAREQGYHLVLWTDPLDTPEALMELGQSRLVDGVVLMEVKLNDWRIEVLRRLQIPCATIGRPANPADLSWVDIDFDQAVHDALDRLTGYGHRTFLFINQPEHSYRTAFGPTVRVLAAFNRECLCRKVEAHSVFCDRDAVKGREVVVSALDQWPDTRAILVMNDQSLPGVLQGLRDRGLRTPEDVSLVALLTPERLALHFWPRLSLMTIPGQALGRLGVLQLIAQLEGQPAPGEGSHLQASVWNEGGTTGPCPGISSPLKKEAL